MKSFRSVAGVLVTAALMLSLPARVSNRAPNDWPQWRGPNRDGISAERGLLKDWPASGPPLAWRATGAGEGYSSFATSNGRLYTMGARGDTEYVIAFDQASGKRLWESAHGRRFSNDRGDGPRATPTIEGDRVYAYGASGDLSVLEAGTGKIIWTINVLKQFGGRNITWGLSESPLVLEDRILINAGGRGASVVALKKTDGSVIWRSQGDQPGYSSAVVHKMGNITEAIFFTATRAMGVEVSTGRLLWSYGQVANNVANIATPIVQGNRVFVSSAYDTGGALLELTPDGSRESVRVREVYFTRADDESPRLVCAHRRAPLRVRQRHPDGDEVRHGPGGVAEPQRGEGLAGLRGRSALSLQRRRGRRARGSLPRRLPRARTFPAQNRQPPHVEPPGRLRRPALPARSGRDLRF